MSLPTINAIGHAASPLPAEENVIHVSAATGKNIHQLKELIARCATENIDKKS